MEKQLTVVAFIVSIGALLFSISAYYSHEIMTWWDRLRNKKEQK